MIDLCDEKSFHKISDTFTLAQLAKKMHDNDAAKENFILLTSKKGEGGRGREGGSEGGRRGRGEEAEGENR